MRFSRQHTGDTSSTGFSHTLLNHQIASSGLVDKDDALGLEEVLRGIQVFGACGSAKTSGNGMRPTPALLERCGIICLSKTDMERFRKPLRRSHANNK